MKASVSALALAICLAACTTASADTPRRRPLRRRRRRRRRAPIERPRRPLDEARAFVARAEKELAEFAVINSRAQWVNATYITDDTDALAAHFGTIGTEMSVRFANEAARYAERRRASTTTPSASSTSCAARWCFRRRPRAGAAAELNTISTRLQLHLRQGPRHARTASR